MSDVLDRCLSWSRKEHGGDTAELPEAVDQAVDEIASLMDRVPLALAVARYEASLENPALAA